MPSPDDMTATAPTDAELIALVDDRLSGFVDATIIPANLNEAIQYALFGGGKRVRPLLCLHSCMAVGGRATDALTAACAVELIHCFSLVHDDLPAMDDDDLRRGRATLHRHTNEAMAILAGDAMTAMAFQVLCGFGGADNQSVRSNVHVLAECTNAMIAGQVYDTMGGLPVGLSETDKLQQVHRNKTAMLLIAAVSMGANCGAATSQQSESLSAYALRLGLMFQAVDDLLDVTQSTEQVGKQTGKDAAAGKLTYPGLLGIDGTRDEIAKLLEQSLVALEPLGPGAEPLRKMARKLAERTK